MLHARNVNNDAVWAVQSTKVDFVIRNHTIVVLAISFTAYLFTLFSSCILGMFLN